MPLIQANNIYLYHILESMLEISLQKITLDDASPFFAYRRVLGLEVSRRVEKRLQVEEEFTQMWPKGKLSDAVNQGLNLLAVHQGRIE